MSLADALGARLGAAIDMLQIDNLGPVRAALLQLCQAAIAARQDDLIDSDRFRRLMAEPQAQAILCDVISVIWVEIDIARDATQSALLVEFIEALVSRSLLPPNLLRVRLEHDLLAKAGVIESVEQAKRSDRLWRTKMLYTQPKFNLCREESEGFAKLIVELDGASRRPIAPNKFKNRIASLIGYFDLDPNRVGDLFLDVMIRSYDNRPSYLLLRNLLMQIMAPGSSMTALVGVKFQRQAQTLSPTMYSVAVDLIEQNFVNAVDLFLGYLSPVSIDDLDAMRHKIEDRIRTDIEQFTHVNLNADKKGAQDKPYGNPVLQTWDEPCQKLDLIAALLTHEGDRAQEAAWTLLKMASSAIPARYASVSLGLARNLEHAIDPYYRQLRRFTVLRLVPLPDLPVPADDVLELIWRYLSYLGPILYSHTILFAKLCRVLSQHLADLHQNNVEITVDSHPILNDILCCSLLGAFSLMPGTTGTAGELHSVLQQLSYPHRYALYHAWRNSIYLSPEFPELTLAMRYAERHTRYFRKRIIAGKIKEVGRQLTRFCHQNPLVVMQLIIEQIQSFDNLSAPAVDSFKYVTALSHDTIPFVILNELCASKDKLSNDAQAPASWFQSLCAFSGLVARRYPNIMQLQPLITYVAAQLKSGASPVDLLLLRELITNMSSVVVIEEMSGAQILAQGGSRTLREALIESQQPRAKIKRNPPFLLAALQDSELLAPLYILMGQQISQLTTMTSSMSMTKRPPELRALAHQLDQVREVLLFYKEFLDMHLVPLKTYAASIPSLYELVHQYHLTPEIAFALVRPVLHVPRIASLPEHTANGDSIALAATCRSLVPAQVWRSISPSLFAMFWSLSLYDIYVPQDQYEDQDRRLEQKMTALTKQPAGENADARKAQKERDRLKRIQERLQKDLAEQKLNHSSVMNKIQSEASSWLADCVDRSSTTIVFLQHCVLPRVASSAADALYAAKFCRLMHDQNTIRTLQIYTDVVRLVRPVLSSATSNESSRFGRFCCELLAYLNEWRAACPADESTPMPSSIAWLRDPTKDETITVLEFIKFIQKWSSCITKSLCRLFKSPEPHIVQNALLYLNAVCEQWPRSSSHGQRLLAAVSQLQAAQAPGSSLRILSQGVLAQLEKKKSDWVEDVVVEVKPPPQPEPEPTPPAAPPAPPPRPESPAHPSRRTRGKSPSEHGRRSSQGSSVAASSTGSLKPVSSSPTYDDSSKRRRVERGSSDKSDLPSHRNEASSRSDSYRDHGYHDRSESSSGRGMMSDRMGDSTSGYMDRKTDDRSDQGRSDRFKDSGRFESSRDKDSNRFESTSRSERMTDSRSERMVIDSGRSERMEMSRSERGMESSRDRGLESSRGSGSDRNRSRSDRESSGQRRRRQ